jgi:hypothetical protein
MLEGSEDTSAAACPYEDNKASMKDQEKNYKIFAGILVN